MGCASLIGSHHRQRHPGPERLYRGGVDAVPFVDLQPTNGPLAEKMLAVVAEVVDDGELTNGRAVAAFETAFAGHCGAAHAVGVASGLDALRLSLQALGVGQGASVVIPALTFAATAEAVVQVGAEPVFADVDAVDCTLDVEAAAAAVTSSTRALLPVHLYGQMADVAALASVAARADASLVEDACQAHGAVRAGVRAGSAGIAAAFSFYPTKNLGALGDAGAVTTSDAEVAARVRALREHGQVEKHRHAYVGWTSRLDTIQAAALLAKLPLLDRWNRERAHAAAAYGERLAGVGDLVLPRPRRGTHAWHLFVVRSNERDALARSLQAAGVAFGVHYPQPVHLLPPFQCFGGGRGVHPVAERIAETCLSLPLFPGISEQQIERVVAAVEGHFAGAHGPPSARK